MFRPKVTAALAAVAIAGGLTLAAGPASAGNVAWSVSVGGPGFAVSAGGPGYRGAYWARPYARPYYRPYYHPHRLRCADRLSGAGRLSRPGLRTAPCCSSGVPAPVWGGAYRVY